MIFEKNNIPINISYNLTFCLKSSHCYRSYRFIYNHNIVWNTHYMVNREFNFLLNIYV